MGHKAQVVGDVDGLKLLGQLLHFFEVGPIDRPLAGQVHAQAVEAQVVVGPYEFELFVVWPWGEPVVNDHLKERNLRASADNVVNPVEAEIKTRIYLVWPFFIWVVLAVMTLAPAIFSQTSLGA